MQIYLGNRTLKIFLGFILVGIVLILFSAGSSLSAASAQGAGTLLPGISETVVTPLGTPQPGEDASVNVRRFSGQQPVQKVYSFAGPSVPPPGFQVERQVVATPEFSSAAANGLSMGASANGFGCGAVGGVMSAAYYDQNGYQDIYTGTANGGVMPLDERLWWPTFTMAGNTWQSNALEYSQIGVDGRTTRGHVEDFVVSYDIPTPDPWKANGWAQHTWDSVADFMYTSQTNFISKDGEIYPLNVDGVTSFYLSPPLNPTPVGYSAANPYTADIMSSNSQPDGTLGMKQFYQSRGYAVGAAYNQPTDNIVAGGFSFAQFRAEIDAGRPVYIGLTDHAIVGIGYDAASNLIYLYDGWDYNTHSMPWGGSYAGMQMQFVSIVYPVPGTPHLYTISGNVGVANATITYTGGSTIADANGKYSFTVSESWFGTVIPSKAGYTFEPATRSYANVVASVIAQNYNDINLLKDPGFEPGTSKWTETHVYSSPLCTAATCGGNGAHTGSGWAWFGGITASDTETLSQTVTIPNGFVASLDFYLEINEADAGSDAADIFTVKVDGTTVFSANATQIYYFYSGYRPINVNLSSYADGKSHEIKFSSVTSGQVVSFFLDDVSLLISKKEYTISGNTGVGGVTLSYTDGALKTVIADGAGNYTIAVPFGWSGVVTPYKSGYTFAPTSKPYSNVQNNQTNQDYTATACVSCADVNFTIGGNPKGSYSIPSGQSLVLKYPVDGAVVISNTTGTKFVASLNQWRRYNTGVSEWTGVTQSLALPLAKVSNIYVMPRYDYTDTARLYNAVLLANVDTVSRDITVTIGGVVKGTYTLAPSESQYKTYQGVAGGPLVVSSVAGAKIVASLYELKKDPGTVGWIGQSEMMGSPWEDISDTYLIPIYFGDPSHPGLKASLYIANVDTVARDITVKIGGVVKGTYTLQKNTSQVLTYPVDGAVEISSASGAKIVASLNQWRRYNTGVNEWTGVTQTLALPLAKVSNIYVMPRYDYADSTRLYDAVLIANVDTVSRAITVTIGGTPMGTYTLAPSESQYKTYLGTAGGPLVVSSVTGAKIVASLYELKKDPGTSGWIDQSEMMGLPWESLAATYLIPIYFGDPSHPGLNASLFIGVP